MTESWSLLPNPITESQLIQLAVGDEFYDIDLGNSARLKMTKYAERNDVDTGWAFEGKILEINGVIVEEPDTVPYFISDEAGFAWTTVCISSKYYEEVNK